MHNTFNRLKYKMALSIIIGVLLIIQSCHQINGMHLTDITVPEVVDFRHKIELSCEYNMNGKTLHSVKWYKDSMEFFRYAPEMVPKYMNFTVDGVKLADQMFNCDDTQCSVTLEQLRPATSGLFKCEISADAPHFNLISGTANMTVAALPRHDPDITGLSQSYAIGDYIDANCTSDQSNPPSDLAWYIDERKVPNEYLRPQQETAVHIGEFMLFYRTLPLRLKIEKQHFHFNGNSFTLKCEATFGRYTHLTRAKSTRVFIDSADDLTNQKLVNSKSAAAAPATACRKFLQTVSGYSLIVILLAKNLV